jgi:ligand-binding sensor domain-containing protein
VCDNKNGIWISTSEGISYYKKQTGEFYNFRHNPGDSNSLANDEYAIIYLPDDNNAWVTNTTALYRFDSLLQYKRVNPGLKMTWDQKEIDSYSTLVLDRQNQLWGASGNVLFLLDNQTMRIKQRFKNCPQYKNNLSGSHLQY